MSSDSKDTLVDTWLRWLKNKRGIAILIVVGVVVIAVSSFGQSVQKLIDLFNVAPPPPPGVVVPTPVPFDLDKLQADLTETQRLIAIHKRKIAEFDRSLQDMETQLSRTKGSNPQTDEEIRKIVASVSLQEKLIEQVQTYRTKEQNDLELQKVRVSELHKRIAARP